MYTINKKNNQLEYPKSNSSAEHYLKDENGSEAYIANKNIEVYAFNFHNKEEIFARNRNSLPFYAKYDDVKEIYPIDLKNNFEKFININNRDIYCKNKNGFEYYPLDDLGRNKVAQYQNEFVYAKSDAGFFYPLNEFGSEFAVKDNEGNHLIITSKSGKLIVPKNRNGSVNYEKDKNNADVPYMFNKINFVGTNIIGMGQYPRTENSCEFYPDDGISPKFAIDVDGKMKYALSKDNIIIYPLSLNDEIYITDEYSDSYIILLKQIKHFKRYARKKNSEIYPIKSLNNDSYAEMMILDLYARNSDLKEIYPKDSNKNQYVNSIGFLLDFYPVTCDGNVIIPNIENEPIIKPNDLHLLKEIKCLLYRPGFKTYDFLINCSSDKYSILHSKSFVSNNSFLPVKYLKYIIIILCTIAFILFVVLIS